MKITVRNNSTEIEIDGITAAKACAILNQTAEYPLPLKRLIQLIEAMSKEVQAIDNNQIKE